MSAGEEASPGATSSSALPRISVEELHDAMQHQVIGQDFIVIDVRRTDIEGEASYVIPGAVNLPAQTFQATLSGSLSILTSVKNVIFHCSSSNGRGPRCAGWYQAELDRCQITSSKAVVLSGGIKAWAHAYADELVTVA